MISYLISDPKFYGSDDKSISFTLSKALSFRPIDYACFRDKGAANYEKLALSFIKTCNEHNVKAILHTFWQNSRKLGAFGVHFATDDFDKIELAKREGLFVVASAHSLIEVQKACDLGADLVTISPIFYTPDKNSPLGLVKLKEITDKIPRKCIALGGISDDAQIEAVKLSGAVGFAAIRYFVR